MPDVFTKDKRSAVMGLIKGSKNLSTELRLIVLMRLAGIKGWRRGSQLPGRPDFIFPKAKVVVFADGDFWHSHPKKSRIPTGNRDFWVKKLSANKRRDRRNNRLLRLKGWTVVRIWEWSIKHHPTLSMTRLQRALGAHPSKLKTKAG